MEECTKEIPSVTSQVYVKVSVPSLKLFCWYISKTILTRERVV